MAPTAILLQGDSLQLLAAPNGFRSPEGEILRADACITDPPYGFDFAGQEKDWDTFQASNLGGAYTPSEAEHAAQFAEFSRKWAYAMRAVLKPGSHLLAFSADRTIDLLGRGLREASYDLVRVLFWLYTSGQVKNPNDLRPGCEPIFVGRITSDSNGKPLNNLSLNKLFKESGRGQMDAQTWKAEDGKHPTNVLISQDLVDYDQDLAAVVEKHAGTFFVSKPNSKDRDYGCESLEVSQKFLSRLACGRFTGKCHDCQRNLRLSFRTHKCHYCKGSNITITESEVQGKDRKNFHPTVKSIELMRRLVRLVSRPGHTIIDPFMGSGTTGVAAILEGRSFIGIEREPDYFKIANARIQAALAENLQGVTS